MTSSILLQLLVDMWFNFTQERRQLRRVVFVQLNIFLDLLICLNLKPTKLFFISTGKSNFINENYKQNKKNLSSSLHIGEIAARCVNERTAMFSVR